MTQSRPGYRASLGSLSSMSLLLAALVLPACTGEVATENAVGAQVGATPYVAVPDGEEGYEGQTASVCYETEECGNGVDDDCDTFTDCEDEACKDTQACNPNCVPQLEDCTDGIDGDCDGKVDNEDEDCGHTSCVWHNVDCGDEVNHCQGDAACYHQWVEQRCDGTINSSFVDGQQVFSCNQAEDCITYRCQVQPKPCAWQNVDCSGEVDSCNGEETCYQDWMTQRCDGAVSTSTQDGKKVFNCSDDATCTRYRCQVQPPPACVWETIDCAGQVDNCNGVDSCYLKWVTQRCSGPVVETAVGAQTRYACSDKPNCRTYTCQTEPPTTPPVCTWGSQICSGLGHCNLHDGSNEQACYNAGNGGNCTAKEFTAWCTRRVPGQEHIWDDFIRDWVDDRCDGPVTSYTNDSGKLVYKCEDQEDCMVYECQTPLVLVFDPAGSVPMTTFDGNTSFDFSAAQDGTGNRTDWPTARTPWLVLDRDEDGAITSARELFGSATPMAGGTAEHGFAALATLDRDGNQRVDAADAGFGQLKLWYDENGDRQSQPAELRSLAEAGVVSLGLDMRLTKDCDARHNCGWLRATFQWRDVSGSLRQGTIVDIHLGNQAPLGTEPDPRQLPEENELFDSALYSPLSQKASAAQICSAELILS